MPRAKTAAAAVADVKSADKKVKVAEKKVKAAVKSVVSADKSLKKAVSAVEHESYLKPRYVAARAVKHTYKHINRAGSLKLANAPGYLLRNRDYMYLPSLHIVGTKAELTKFLKARKLEEHMSGAYSLRSVSHYHLTSKLARDEFGRFIGKENYEAPAMHHGGAFAAAIKLARALRKKTKKAKKALEIVVVKAATPAKVKKARKAPAAGKKYEMAEVIVTPGKKTTSPVKVAVVAVKPKRVYKKKEDTSAAAGAAIILPGLKPVGRTLAAF